MKYFLILSFFVSMNSFALDKELAKEYSDLTESYADKIKSTNPNKAVVFISSRIDTDYMDLREVDIEVMPDKIRINRPTGSSKMQNIDTCRSEEGSAVIQGSSILVDSVILKRSRVLCTGNQGNYREAYTTFREN